MTSDELNAIKARLAGAMKCDDWGTHGTNELTFTPEKPGRNAAIWYGDGDMCAEVHGNMGLGIDGDAVGEFFAHSIEDVKKLASEVEFLRREQRELTEKNGVLTGWLKDSIDKGDEALRQIARWEKYATLLGAELDETAQIAYLHHWRSSRVEEGKKLREELGIPDPHEPANHGNNER